MIRQSIKRDVSALDCDLAAVLRSAEMCMVQPRVQLSRVDASG
jgi:hypothetical protein